MFIEKPTLQNYKEMILTLKLKKDLKDQNNTNIYEEKNVLNRRFIL